MLPSGARRYFLHAPHHGERTWRIIGDASATTLEEAQAHAASMLAAIRHQIEATPSAQDTRFEAVAKSVVPAPCPSLEARDADGEMHQHSTQDQSVPAGHGRRFHGLRPLTSVARHMSSDGRDIGFARGRLMDELAFEHHYDAIRESHQLVEVLAYEQDRRPRLRAPMSWACISETAPTSSPEHGLAAISTSTSCESSRASTVL